MNKIKIQSENIDIFTPEEPLLLKKVYFTLKVKPGDELGLYVQETELLIRKGIAKTGQGSSNQGMKIYQV